jgi:hypothetical protein
MNLRNWSKYHTLGILIGITTTIIFTILIKLTYSAFNNPQLWFLHETKSKLISLASIANLGWFHWFIKYKKTDLAMGVILATFVNLIVILYLKTLV